MRDSWEQNENLRICYCSDTASSPWSPITRFLNSLLLPFSPQLLCFPHSLLRSCSPSLLCFIIITSTLIQLTTQLPTHLLKPYSNRIQHAKENRMLDSVKLNTYNNQTNHSQHIVTQINESSLLILNFHNKQTKLN